MIKRENTRERGGEAKASSVIVHVDFRGDTLDVVQDMDGIWLPLKRVSEALGLNARAQIRRLQRQPWATAGLKPAVAEDGKTRELFCIHLDCLPMWLATIESSRVAPEIRDKLVHYQRECAQVLRNHFFGEGIPALTTDVVNEVHEDRLERQRAIASAWAPDATMEDLSWVLGGMTGWNQGQLVANLAEELVLVRAALQHRPGSRRVSAAAAAHLRGLERRLMLAVERA